MGKSMNEARKSDNNSAETVPSLLRVAAVQLPRLEPEDRAAIMPYVKRDMARHEMTE
jgi:hypothetical protein